MTQLDILRAWVPDITDDALLTSALERAKLVILELRFPFGFTETQDLEPQYKGLQIEIAVEMLSKMGAEGETSHSENGVSRGYENAGVSESLKRRVIPVAKAVMMDAESEA